MDSSSTHSVGSYIQTTGYYVTLPAVHNEQAHRIRTGFWCALAACALLSSCAGQSPPDVGDRAFQFELKSLQGDSMVFTPAAGRPQILYFWADWCPRCEDDFHLMERLYKQWSTQENSPRLLAVDVGQSEEHIRNFVKRMDISFPIYLDHDGKIARSFGVKGLPTYFLVDKQGVIRHLILGWADEKTLLEEIAKME